MRKIKKNVKNVKNDGQNKIKNIIKNIINNIVNNIENLYKVKQLPLIIYLREELKKKVKVTE